jgi:MFS family permease
MMSLAVWRKRIWEKITNRENYSRKSIFALVYLGSYCITLLILGILGTISPDLIYISWLAGIWVGLAFGGVIGIVILSQIAPEALFETGLPIFFANFAQIIMSLVLGLICGSIMGVIAGTIVGLITLGICGIPYLILQLGIYFFLILVVLGVISEIVSRLIVVKWNPKIPDHFAEEID